jgi:hypothetical protein
MGQCGREAERILHLVEKLRAAGKRLPLKRLLELAEYLECDEAELELTARMAKKSAKAAPPDHAPEAVHVGKLLAGATLDVDKKGQRNHEQSRT